MLDSKGDVDDEEDDDDNDLDKSLLNDAAIMLIRLVLG